VSLWANRFYSTVLDEPDLWAVVRYLERNPVRAGIAMEGDECLWSSARDHALGHPDSLLSPGRPFPGANRAGDWRTSLSCDTDGVAIAAIRRNAATGRPTGAAARIAHCETLPGRRLTAGERGCKPKRSSRRIG
jgi:putative transposase